MSGDIFNEGNGIEARLDRSLQNQVRVPKLGKGFDSAVWARIKDEEAQSEKSAATNPSAVASRALHASRWLAITNIVGVTATLAVVLYFTQGSFGGIEAPPALEHGVNLPMPVISEEALARILAAFGQLLGAVALLFGLSFTSLGRRLRASFF